MLESLLDLSKPPAGQVGGFDNHQLVRQFAEDVRGGEPLKLTVFDPLHQLMTYRPKGRVRAEMVDQDVRVDEYRVSGHQVGKIHGASSGRNSESSAIRSNDSASPVQPMMPYAASRGLSVFSIVIRTCSCSFSGSGWASLSMPFSYVASAVRDMVHPREGTS